MNDHALHSVTAAEILRTEPLGQKLLALNNDHARALSWLEPERLEYLVSQAFLTRRIGDLDAFMLVFDQDASYDSPNFIWFRAVTRASCMSTASWWLCRRAGGVARERSIRICSTTRSAPGMTVFAARSI